MYLEQFAVKNKGSVLNKTIWMLCCENVLNDSIPVSWLGYEQPMKRYRVLQNMLLDFMERGWLTYLGGAAGIEKFKINKSDPNNVDADTAYFVSTSNTENSIHTLEALLYKVCLAYKHPAAELICPKSSFTLMYNRLTSPQNVEEQLAMGAVGLVVAAGAVAAGMYMGMRNR